ncbi:MAG: acyl-CoA dehydrogenase family protein, partial [Sciscionella sp.]
MSAIQASGGLGFDIPPELDAVVRRVRAFVEQDVLPIEASLADLTDMECVASAAHRLRDRARELNIYIPHLPPEYGGLGLGVLPMALISQECGRSSLAPLAINAMAPDEGNMHLLLEVGTEEQKARWLRPLAEGRIRSCFAMT